MSHASHTTPQAACKLCVLTVLVNVQPVIDYRKRVQRLEATRLHMANMAFDLACQYSAYAHHPLVARGVKPDCASPEYQRSLRNYMRRRMAECSPFAPRTVPRIEA